MKKPTYLSEQEILVLRLLTEWANDAAQFAYEEEFSPSFEVSVVYDQWNVKLDEGANAEGRGRDHSLRVAALQAAQEFHKSLKEQGCSRRGMKSSVVTLISMLRSAKNSLW